MIRFLAGVLGLWLSISAAHAANLPPFAIDILSWPRASSADIGCRMEKTLGHRDTTFNCDLKDYKSPGNPCKDPNGYYEGPKFPEALAARVHPLARDVQLSFEHGDLQMVIVHLKGDFSEQEVRKALGLPDNGARPQNVMYLSVQANPGVTSVVIQGFDHMGGADIDCPPADTKR